MFTRFREALPEKTNTLLRRAFSGGRLPKMIITQAQADVAYEAGLLAFHQYIGTEPVPPSCPQCGDNDPNSRNGNDYKCSACGWEAAPGTFGAAYLKSLAQQSFPNPDTD